MGLANTRFYLDDGTGTFADDITPYVLLVEGLGLSRGRGDTDSGPTAGTLNIVVNNKTGAFTPGSTVLGSPSIIKVDQQIRVKETINGTTVTRFTGYVKSWALGWRSTTEASAIVRITATDAQARAERRVLRSVVEEEILLDSPSAYFMLNEVAGSTAAVDTSGGQQSALTLVVPSGATTTFGSTGVPISTDLTAVLLNGSYLRGTLAATPTTIEFWMNSVAASGTILSIGGHTITYSLTPSQRLVIDGTGTGVEVSDGTWHLITLRAGSNALVDGNDTGVACPSWGSATFNLGADALGGTQMAATFQHLSFYSTTLSTTRASAHRTAGKTGFANESGVARITRLAGYANIAIGTTDTSLTNVAFTEFTGRSAWECIQEVADAEMGVAYIAGDGTLTFHNRQLVTMKTAPDLTLSGFVTTDAEPTTDDQDLLNYLETSSSVTGISQVVRNTASETTHGRYSDSRSYLVSSDDEAKDRANWLVSTRAEPAASGRYGTLTVNLYGMTPAQQLATVQALEHGCWLRVLNMPTQTTGGTTVDVVVEGIVENQSGDGWQIACNVVPKATLYPKVFILDSSVLDGPDLLGV